MQLLVLLFPPDLAQFSWAAGSGICHLTCVSSWLWRLQEAHAQSWGLHRCQALLGPCSLDQDRNPCPNSPGPAGLSPTSPTPCHHQSHHFALATLHPNGSDQMPPPFPMTALLRASSAAFCPPGWPSSLSEIFH
jgi:hypothetical protein